MNRATIKSHELTPAFYLLLPLVVAAAPFAVEWAAGHNRWLYSEFGAVEWLTVLFLLAGIFYAAASLRIALASAARWLVAWVVLLLLGAVYFAGEELSWGQHVFQWVTPEAWREINDQEETNLHNTHAIFDQLPRLLLTLAALVGGILVPLYRRFRSARPSGLARFPRFDRIVCGSDENAWSRPCFIWPTWVCLPVSVAAVVLSPFDTLIESLGTGAPSWLDTRAGELKECLLALFICIYIVSLYRRLNLAGILRDAESPAENED